MKRLELNKTSRKFYTIWMISAILVIFVFLQHSQLDYQPIILPNEQAEERLINEPIQPIPLKLELDENKIKLGEKLFNDAILSRNNAISCVSCHSLQTGGTDRLPLSIGINHTVGNFNALTVFNSGFNFKQLWEGKVDTLEEQIDGPINNPQEMGSNWLEVISKLKQKREYRLLFTKIYSDGINRDNVKDSLANFVRSLYTPNSRFDQFLRGNQNILTTKEKEGYRRFKAYGCVSCHQGLNVGGNMLQIFDVRDNYFDSNIDSTELNINSDQQNHHSLRVPSLRNVALTWPYFHDGSVETLEAAVNRMAEYQLGRKLTTEDIDLIVSFLKTLTGQYQGKQL